MSTDITNFHYNKVILAVPNFRLFSFVLYFVLFLSPPNKVSEGTMKRAPYVCVSVRASGLKMLRFASSLSFRGWFWFCLFYLIGLGPGFKTSTQNFEIHYANLCKYIQNQWKMLLLCHFLADFDSVCFIW